MASGSTYVPDYLHKIVCDTKPGMPSFKCSVASCSNAYQFYDEHSHIKYHSFPSENNCLDQWRNICGVSEESQAIEMVCSDHFEPDDYERNFKEEFTNPDYRRKLKATAVPHINITKTNQVQNIGSDLITKDDLKDILGTINEVHNYCSKPTEKANVNPKIKDDNKITKKTITSSSSDDTNNKIQQQTDNSEDVILEKRTLNPADVKEAVDASEILQEDYMKLLKEDKELHKEKRKYTTLIKSCKKKLCNYTERSVGDKEKLKKIKAIFSDNQINLLKGKKVVWTDDDLANGLVLRHMGGKKLYLYMKNTLNYPLPSLSCIQKWAAERQK